jgi:dihydrofolate reductase
MRKVTFGVANSLDNYIAGPGEAIDWLAWSDDVTAIMKDYMDRVDAILMGRKTWEFAVKAGGGGGGKSKTRTYVFSRTLDKVEEGAELVRGDAAAFVRELKREEGGEICVMGGGALAAALLEGGVVDELGFNIHPVLLGGGVPLFHPMKRRVELELIEARAIAHGCVFVRYRVKD